MGKKIKHPAGKMLDAMVIGGLLSGGWYAAAADGDYVGPFANEETARSMVGWMDSSYAFDSGRVEELSAKEANDLAECAGRSFHYPSVKADYQGWDGHGEGLLVWSIRQFVEHSIAC